jgi:hypothetical protein
MAAIIEPVVVAKDEKEKNVFDDPIQVNNKKQQQKMSRYDFDVMCTWSEEVPHRERVDHYRDSSKTY